MEITDTGIGIADADIPRVLEPFGQVPGAQPNRDRGTGLGLPLTKRLVELHGGTLRLTSTVGVGTRVALTLPATRVSVTP